MFGSAIDGMAGSLEEVFRGKEKGDAVADSAGKHHQVRTLK